MKTLTATHQDLESELWRCVIRDFGEYPNIQCTLALQGLDLPNRGLEKYLGLKSATFTADYLYFASYTSY
jgi:hypothetical protein